MGRMLLAGALAMSLVNCGLASPRATERASTLCNVDSRTWKLMPSPPASMLDAFSASHDDTPVSSVFWFEGGNGETMYCFPGKVPDVSGNGCGETRATVEPAPDLPWARQRGITWLFGPEVVVYCPEAPTDY